MWRPLATAYSVARLTFSCCQVALYVADFSRVGFVADVERRCYDRAMVDAELNRRREEQNRRDERGTCGSETTKRWVGHNSWSPQTLVRLWTLNVMLATVEKLLMCHKSQLLDFKFGRFCAKFSLIISDVWPFFLWPAFVTWSENRGQTLEVHLYQATFGPPVSITWFLCALSNLWWPKVSYRGRIVSARCDRS